MSPTSAIEELLLNFSINGTNEEEIRQWTKSENFLSECVDSICNSRHSNVVFVSSVCLKSVISNDEISITDDSINTMYGLITERLISSTPIKFTDNINKMLLRNISILIKRNRMLFENVKEIFPPNFLVIIYLDLSKSAKVILNDGDIAHALEVLKAADFSDEWFKCFGCVLLNAKFTYFTDLLERVKLIVGNSSLQKNIISIMEEAFSVPMQNFDSDGEINFVVELYEISQAIIDSIFTGERSEGEYGLVSVLYKELFDYSDFLKLSFTTNSKFVTDFFERFFNVLNQVIADGIDDEAISLLNSEVEFLNFSLNNNVPDILWDFVVGTYNVLINMADAENMRFINSEFGNIINSLTEYTLKLQKIHSKTLEFLTNTVLSQPSPGIFYFLSMSHESYIKMLSTVFCQVIRNNFNPSFAIFFFARKCLKWADDWFDHIMTVVYSLFPLYPFYAAKTISTVAQNLYNKFINNYNTFVLPLFEFIQSVDDFYTIAFLLSALLCVQTRLEPNEYSEVVLEKVRDFIITVVNLNTSNCKASLSYITIIMHGTPKDLSNSHYINFFYSIFDQLYSYLRKFLFDQTNCDILYNISRLVEYSLSHHWANPQQYAEDLFNIISVLLENDLSNHDHYINILLYISVYLDQEVFGRFLRNCQKDSSLYAASIKLCGKVIKKVEQPAICETVYIFLLEILTRNRPCKLAIQCIDSHILDVINRKIKVEDVNYIIETKDQLTEVLVKIMLGESNPDNIQSILNLLNKLGVFTGKENIAKSILHLTGETNESIKFCNSLIEDSIVVSEKTIELASTMVSQLRAR